MNRVRPRIFVINPGSTSTKVALYAGGKAVFEKSPKHERAQIDACKGLMGQVGLRRQAALDALAEAKVALSDIDVFMGRGGLLRPVEGGVYEVNPAMLKDLSECTFGRHASNLGAIIARDLAQRGNGTARAYIADPVVVDELSPCARITGHPAIRKRSIFHALSQKAVAAKAAKRLGKPYEKCNLIVGHIGGGITIAAHSGGRAFDVNNALDGEGPMTPERTGALPALEFCRYAISRKLTVEQAEEMVSCKGGLLAHLGTNDCRVILERIAAGDEHARLVYDAFIYQLAKSIGALAPTMAGKVDAIVLTGEVLRDSSLVRKLRRMVGFLAPVWVYLENSEMGALAAAGLEVYTGVRKAKHY